MKHKVKRIHFVGIGGSGMSGIAEVLLNQGYQISGSDLAASATTERLVALGARVMLGHDRAHVAAVDVVVISSAVKSDNPEVIEARAKRIPVVPRALMLAELMRLKQGIAVAGTHGKTTTTSLVASVLAEGGLDPTFVIGGRLTAAGSNARLGAGEFIVVEADESDASFLHLQPSIAIVTNIDADHMETYGHDFAKLRQAFVTFIENLPFYGSAILCADDRVVREIIPFVSRPMLTYGFTDDVQVRADQVVSDGGRMRFRALRAGKAPLDVTLALPGRHNVLNALAAIAVADELGVADRAIAKALADFRGVGRRFQRYGEVGLPAAGAFTLIDDYGHHPVEIAAVLRAARQAYGGGGRVIAVMQPHRFSRLSALKSEFAACFSDADTVMIADVYAAGEAAIEGVNRDMLVGLVQRAGHRDVHSLMAPADLPGAIWQVARPGDVVVCLGAGNITAWAHALPGQLQQLAAEQAGLRAIANDSGTAA